MRLLSATLLLFALTFPVADGHAVFVLRKGESEPIIGHLVSENARQVVVRVERRESDRNTVVPRAEIEELVYTVDLKRLATLSPAQPTAYREYAEELSEMKADPEARDLEAVGKAGAFQSILDGLSDEDVARFKGTPSSAAIVRDLGLSHLTPGEAPTLSSGRKPAEIAFATRRGSRWGRQSYPRESHRHRRRARESLPSAADRTAPGPWSGRAAACRPPAGAAASYRGRTPGT